MQATSWIKVVGIGMVLGCGVLGPANALPEMTGPQAINFTFPTGTTSFPILFTSDLSPDNENSDLADLLQVTFPGEAMKNSNTQEGVEQLFQKGFAKGNKIDEVFFEDPGLFGGRSDAVALYFDANASKFAVGFVSCSECTLLPDEVTVPEPTTAVVLVSSLVGLVGWGWRQKER